MNNAGQRTNPMSRNQRRIERQAAVQVLLEENEALRTSRNGLHASLCSVLAQKGGEVTITPGTMLQLAQTRMGFAIVPGPGDGEFTLRLIPEPIEGENENGDNGNDGSSNDGPTQTEPEAEIAEGTKALRGTPHPTEGD